VPIGALRVWRREGWQQYLAARQLQRRLTLRCSRPPSAAA